MQTAISTELKAFLLDRALGKPTGQLDSMCEEMFQLYINDPNSSTIRELITTLVAGYEPLSGKHGRDAIDLATGKQKEVKPKSYTSGKARKTNGSGCFNDYTRQRFEQDMAEGLDIIQSLFINDRIAYVVEFSIEAISQALDKHIRFNCEEMKRQYVRNATWSYKDWIQHPSMRIHYIDWDLINQHPKCMNGKMTKYFLGSSMMAEHGMKSAA
jgi:hypothetical protein